MNIHRENYELYFLDFLEGKLDEEQLRQLRLFLLENPDLAEELEGIEKVNLAPHDHPYSIDKNTLRKKVIPVDGIDEQTLESYLVAYLENDLTETDRASVEKFLQLNPSYQYDLELLLSTVSQPDGSVVYPHKERLKHWKLVVFINWRYGIAAAAALVLLFLGWGLFFNDRQVMPEEQLAVTIAPEPERAGNIGTMARLEVVKVEGTSSRPMPVLETRPIATVASTYPISMESMATNEIVHHQKAAIQPGSGPITLEFFAHADAAEDKGRSPGLFGRILRNYGGKARDAQELLAREPGKKERNINFWDIADIGVKGYNTLADREVELEVVRDKTGAPKEYSFRENERVLLSRDMNQP